MVKCNLPPEEAEQLLHSDLFEKTEPKDDERIRDMFEHFMVLSAKKNGKRDAWCTSCRCWSFYEKKKDPEIWKLRHDDIVECPRCGRKVRAKVEGRMGYGLNLSDSQQVIVINVSEKGEIFIESRKYFADWDMEQYNYRIEYESIRRNYIAIGKNQQWKCSNEWDGVKTFRRKWKPMVNVSEPYPQATAYYYTGYYTGMYQVIGAEKLRLSQLKYSAIERYFEEWHNVDLQTGSTRLVISYLAEAAKRPQIEMAVKLGLSEAVCQLIRDRNANSEHLNWRAKNPKDFLKLSGADCKTFMSMPKMEILRGYHEAKSAGTIESMEAYLSVVDKIGIVKSSCIDKAGKYKVNLKQLAKICKDSTEVTMWHDYIGAAERLGLDLTRVDVLLPKNLRERHDDATKNIRDRDDAAKDLAYQRRRKELEKKFAYTADGLSIVVPSGIQQIVQEGKTLQICVGGYAHRHVEGKTTILFLRKERTPERSYICIEVDDKGEIRQIHGYKNEGYPNAVRPKVKYADWLENWLLWVKMGSHRDKSGKPIIQNKERKIA